MSISEKWLGEYYSRNNYGETHGYTELPQGDKEHDPDAINKPYSGEGPDSDEFAGLKQIKDEEKEHKEELGEEL